MKTESQIRHKAFGALIFAALIILLSAHRNEACAQTHYSIGNTDDQLRVIDPATGATRSSVTITLTGKTVLGGNGLATHPFTQQLWAVLRIQGQTGRELVTINPSTGVATSIGNTGDNFAGIAFDATGRLFGVTGDGATTPETLFILGQTNAEPTFFMALGNGDDGEAIAFNRQDGRMYHLSGRGTLNNPVSGKIFEAIDLGTKTTTNIPLSGNTEEALAFMYDGAGIFLYADLDANLFRLTAGGEETFIVALDHLSKGLARVDVLPFAAFTPELEVKLRPGASDDEFELEAIFVLDSASDGIAPLTEDVTVQVGPFSTTIPAGSFTRKGGEFRFKSVNDDVRLKANIRSLRGARFKFEAVGKCVDLTGIANPVTVGLTIGNDGASATITADIESKHGQGKCGHGTNGDKDDD